MPPASFKRVDVEGLAYNPNRLNSIPILASTNSNDSPALLLLESVPSRRSLKYEFQIGTYGYAVKKEFGRLDGMFLIYYNKDTSLMKQIPVDLSYTEKALQFWKEVNSEHKLGMPKLEAGLSPVDSWECSFCNYKDLCQRTD